MMNAPPRPLKVAFVTTGFTRGGAETVLARLLHRLDRRAIDPVVVSLGHATRLDAEVEASGIVIHRLGMRAGRFPGRSFGQLVRLLRSIAPDLVQGWMYHGSVAAQLALMFDGNRIPSLWGIHGYVRSANPLSNATVWLSGRLARLPSRIVYASEADATLHETRLAYPRANRSLIPNGYDTDVFRPSATDRASVRRELGLADDTVLIGHFARYHPVKNHANLLRAVATLAAERCDVRFVLAGTDVDWDNTELAGLVRALNIQDRVDLIGEREDMPRLAAGIDALCLSSDSEALPNVIGEAMACAVPCVITAVGDGPRLIADTGFAVPPRDDAALARALRHIVGLGSEGRRALGAAARQRIAEHYSLHAMVRSYQRLYEIVASGLPLESRAA